MSADEQAFTGMAGLSDVNGEWNRLQFAIRSVMNQMVTSSLVLVKAVGDGTVDVQPMVAQVDGAGNAVPHGTVHGLPVWQLQGGVSGVIITPAVGDIGLAIFTATDISGVKRAKAPTTPGSARRFDWADGIYLGGCLNAPPTQFVKLDDDGVTITSLSVVTINAPGGLVVMGDVETTGTLMNNGKDVGSTHTHSGVTTGGGTSGPPV